MKTTLPAAIATVTEAQKFLADLYENGESYHPEDSAHDIIWDNMPPPTPAEADQLNKLMEDIYKLPGNENHPQNMVFDPCGFLLMMDRDFTVKDLTGRGYFTTTTGLQLYRNWEHDDEDQNEVRLLDFADNAAPGDTWETAAVLITCIERP